MDSLPAEPQEKPKNTGVGSLTLLLGNLPNPGIEPVSPALQADSLPTELPGKQMGKIKDRNGIDLTEAANVKKRWQKYTEELYKKDLNDPGNHDGVITDLEPDIMEC